jgi:hypothetical protein
VFIFHDTFRTVLFLILLLLNLAKHVLAFFVVISKQLLNNWEVLQNLGMPNRILFLEQGLKAEDHILNLRDKANMNLHLGIRKA